MLLCFSFGYYVNKISNNNNETIEKPQQTVSEQKIQERKQEIETTAENIKKKPVQKVQDFSQIDRIFYTKLLNCEQLDVATENGYIEYVIYGKEDGTCKFTNKQVGFADTICAIPMHIATKYAEEGLNEIRQLDELKRQNKSGFVQSSQFISDINNNRDYCHLEYYGRK